MLRSFLILGLFSLLLVWVALERKNNVLNLAKPQHESREVEIRKYDLNADNVLQLDERQSVMKKKFQEADSNNDGSVSYDEVRSTIAGFEQRGDHFGKWVDHHGLHLGNRIRDVDLDKDGTVSQEEYFSYFGAHYERMDKDEDGNITVQEYMQHTSRLIR